MAKGNAAAVVRGMDFGTSFLSGIAKGAAKRGISEDSLYDEMKNPKFIEQVLDLIFKKSVSPFPIWKTITVGIRKTADEYRKALAANSFRISDWANDILGEIQFAQEETTLNLVNVSVAELGFTRATSLRDILAKAKEFGLEPCSPEVGPALREQYPDQPLSEVLWIGMKPVRDSNGDPRVFHVYSGDDRWLNAGCDGLGSFWSPDDRFVFVSK